MIVAYRPREGGRLFIDLVPFTAQRFLVLGACAQCGDDALCNYIHELRAAFCGPDCTDRYRNGDRA